MIVREDRLKTEWKWCPFARFASSTDGSLNRLDDGAPVGGCIGSSCMAWRWKPDIADCDTGEFEDGYCGLAGPAERR